MKKFFGFMKATVTGGLLFLIPVVVLSVIIGKAVSLSEKITGPLAARFPVKEFGGVGVDVLMAAAVLLAACFIAGLLARSSPGKRFVRILEYRILIQLPGYSLVKGMGESFAGGEAEFPFRVVLARIEEAWQIGFLMEDLEGGYAAVFIPDAPRPWSGSLFFMSPDRFRLTEMSPASAMKCIRKLGVGSRGLVKGLP